MKIEYKGKQTVIVTMTRKQLAAIEAAIDSVTSIGEHSTSGYDDVFRVEEALSQAQADANGRDSK